MSIDLKRSHPLIWAALFLIILAALLVPSPLTMRRHLVIHSMTWNLTESKRNGEPGVRLIYKDYPTYNELVWSGEVADYLKSLPDLNVNVVFSVVKYWDNLEGYTIVKIGALDVRDKRISGSSGAIGSGNASPWD